MTSLTVLNPDDPCQGCGACCLYLVWPPFYRIDDPQWKRLEEERPELVAGSEIDRFRRREMGQDPDWKAPCLWYDAESQRCKHYEYRPDVCRDFEPGSSECAYFREMRDIK